MRMTSTFYSCSCYFTHNIYIKKYNKHFTFKNANQFNNDYNMALYALGCNKTDWESLIQEIVAEINRRKLLHENSSFRKRFIEENYDPFDNTVYKLKEDFFYPNFIKLVDECKTLNYEEILPLVDELSKDKRLYGFPVFKPEFCQKFLKEFNHFERSSLPKERPNTMNNYGILLDDLGFHDYFSLLLRVKYLDPVAKVLFPDWRGRGLDSHKIFTVGYKSGQDTELGYHFDNSEVTLNVCLGSEFEGGELFFGDMKTVPVFKSTCVLVPHKIGYGIFHRGQQLHGALSITSGERHNLILWMRSSSIRNHLCPMCNSKPSLVSSDDYGDGFTESEKMLCSLT